MRQNWNAVIEAPFGCLGLRTQNGRLVEVEFLAPDQARLAPRDPVARQAAHQLERYFENPKQRFDLPLEVSGTDYQQRTWEALRAIPCGRVLTYGELARQLGSAARAVGGACRANPLAIITPCHRVVAASGYGGFAGQRDGDLLDVKRWLLAHEGAR